MEQSYGPIDHKYGCEYWNTFYSKLVNTGKTNFSLLVEKNGKDGFLMPSITLFEYK